MLQPVARLAELVRALVQRHYLDLSAARVWPLCVLVVYGIVAGFIYNPGMDHPFDKLQHLLFFGLLTLSIHAFFCCRLRISAGIAGGLGLTAELVQALVPHREFSLGDIAANMLGVTLVVAAIMLLRLEVRAALSGGPSSGEQDDEAADAAQAQPAASSSGRSRPS
ncbi:hypothetical protein [Stappia indica]|uniref:hypothetical protein n=1 Tax=Stappia indica TaxID=538381 RepID=UPI00083094A8|nr:hypothetical protein [Stappia indica]